MKTSKPISSISWNSPGYLSQVLSELQESRVISFWCFICHKGEDDEGGKKDHIHLYIEPARTIQTIDIRDLFKEPVKDNKPLGCLDFRPSKFKDWYFYALHDRGYLEIRALTKKYSYSPDNLIVSDDSELQYRVGTIELYSSTEIDRIKKLAMSGKDIEDIILSGLVKLSEVRNLELTWGYVDTAKRAGRLVTPSAPLAGHIPSSQYVGSGEVENKNVDLPFAGPPIKTKGIPEANKDDDLQR